MVEGCDALERVEIDGGQGDVAQTRFKGAVHDSGEIRGQLRVVQVAVGVEERRGGCILGG
jgi:hypothetical protein